MTIFEGLETGPGRWPHLVPLADRNRWEFSGDRRFRSVCILVVLSEESPGFHFGGVKVLFCDGSVQFVKESINNATWRALGTGKGREVIFSTDF
jgi:hypothetical protein